jgi:hypothetical protein
MAMALVDELLPVFDVSDELAVVVEAGTDRTWTGLTSADLIEVGRRRLLVATLGALRALPEIVAHLLHGESPPGAPARLTLRDTTELPADGDGWILFGERPGQELGLGLVGKFWRPVIQYADVDAGQFTALVPALLDPRCRLWRSCSRARPARGHTRGRRSGTRADLSARLIGWRVGGRSARLV